MSIFIAYKLYKLFLNNDSPTGRLSINNRKLCIITGSNQGGKTTFLRSIGLAQLMAQSGLFVAAESFQCCLHTGIFTHFPNEEDQELRYGLLEEELCKLNHIT